MDATREARLSSFEKDLGLQGSQFNTAVSILIVGYVSTRPDILHVKSMC